MSTAKSEELGGAVMLGAAVVALVWANSSAAESYHSFFAQLVGSSVVGLRKPLEQRLQP